MESNPSEKFDPAQVDAGARTVGELLKSRKIGTPELPPLGGPATADKNDAALEQFLKWIESFFPKSKGMFSTETFAKVLLIGAGFALIVLVALLAVWIMRVITKDPNESPTISNPTGSFPLDPEARLVQEIQKCMKQGQWARATRLRWRLYLMRRRLLPALTPNEVLKREDLTRKQYDTMFRNASPSEADYEACARELRALENPEPKPEDAK